jgi:hypothetical protein
MASSVQGWKKKWFYIKDKKSSPADLFGIAPFDAAKNLEKLASWDSPPTEAEMEDVKPLLARIQALKSDDDVFFNWNSTHGIFPSMSSSTSSAPSFEVVVFFWLGRFFGSF